MSELRHVLAVLILATAVTACGDAPPETGDETMDEGAVPQWVTDVAEVADAIEARPGATDSILEAHAMTRPGLDSLLYRIAGDPALTRAYREARSR